MDDPRWAPVAPGDRHHGRIDTRDGGSFWVMRRLHLVGGWFVDTRVGSPEGTLLDRRWVESSSTGYDLVSNRRAELSRLDVDGVLALPTVMDEPRNDLGVLVAHGFRGGKGAPPQAVTIDGEPAGRVCLIRWMRAGPHEVRWSEREARTIELPERTVIHTHRRWVSGLWLPPEHHMVPPVHRCPIRSLRFEDGLLSANRDVRRAALSW